MQVFRWILQVVPQYGGKNVRTPWPLKRINSRNVPFLATKLKESQI